VEEEFDGKKLELEIIERLQRIHYKEEEDMWV
jgi:hypothetical protein